jgi:hypothetical protein
MSQFNLTPEEDAIVIAALREKANVYHTMCGVTDPALEALVAKVEGQLPVVTPVVEDPPDLLAVEPTDEEVAAHFAEEASTRKKKAK